MARRSWWVTTGCLFGLAASSLAADERVDYQRQIQPLLARHCYACHGPDRELQENELRLDRREDALESAITPGDPAASTLLERVLEEDLELRMPPPASKKPPLTDEEIDLLGRWIEQGATFTEHWSHQVPARVMPLKSGGWSRGPIDDFVVTRHKQQGLTAASAADRRTLVRRLSLDLLGLPPTEGEVDAFLADTAPGAYERLVDRLLASPHFGERMAVYWLDLVRYADTGGYHGDNDRDHAPYRDYVVEAFNENLTYDRFMREQLAGDLLPDRTRRQQVASGFNRLNMTTREGGAQPKEYMAIYAADRVRNTGSIFLGLTLGCCQCHDHKFDPYSLRDFYSMAAFFADVQETLVGIQKPLLLLDPQQTQRIYDLDEASSASQSLLDGESAAWDAAQARWEADEERFTDLVWTDPTQLQIASRAGNAFEQLDDRSLLALGDRAASDTYLLEMRILRRVVFPPLKSNSFRMPRFRNRARAGPATGTWCFRSSKFGGMASDCNLPRRWRAIRKAVGKLPKRSMATRRPDGRSVPR